MYKPMQCIKHVLALSLEPEYVVFFTKHKNKINMYILFIVFNISRSF